MEGSGSQKSAAELELERLRRLRSLGDLASGLVHDLNNVLGAVVAYVDTQSRKDLSDVESRMVHRLDESLDRAAHLLRVVARFALVRGRGHEKCRLSELVGDATELFATRVRHGGYQVELSAVGVDDEDPLVWVDRAQAMGVIVRFGLYFFETAGYAEQLDVTFGVQVASGRRFGFVEFCSEGDAASDAVIRSFADDPTRGYEQLADATDVELCASLIDLTAHGGEFEVGEDTTRRQVTLRFPVAAREA